MASTLSWLCRRCSEHATFSRILHCGCKAIVCVGVCDLESSWNRDHIIGHCASVLPDSITFLMKVYQHSIWHIPVKRRHITLFFAPMVVCPMSYVLWYKINMGAIQHTCDVVCSRSRKYIFIEVVNTSYRTYKSNGNKQWRNVQAASSSCSTNTKNSTLHEVDWLWLEK